MADTNLINLDEAVRGLGDRAVAGIGKAEKQMEAREAANRKAAEGIRGDMAEMEDVTARMRNLDVERKPPEAPKFEGFQAPEEQYDPVEAFGSTASVLGIMASLMTKQPLTSALNAGAGVMEAYKQKDVEAYNKAFKEWESNSNQALKFAQFERGLYQDALQKHGNDLNALQAEFRTIAAQTQNQALLATLESGDPQATLNLVNALSKAANDLPGIISSAKDLGLENQAVLEAQQAAAASGKPWTAEKEAAIRSGVRKQLAASKFGNTSEMYAKKLAINAEYNKRAQEIADMPDGPEKSQARNALEQWFFDQTRGLPGGESEFSWQRQVRMLQSAYPWLSDQQALALATGKISSTRHPHTGQMYQLNEVTNMLVPTNEGTPEPGALPPGQGEEAPPSTPPAEAPPEREPEEGEEGRTIMPGVDVEGAFGVGGSLRRVANTITDSLVGKVPFDKQEEAFSALENLQNRTRIFLQSEVEGRPSVFLLQMLGQLVAEPYSVGMGPVRAAKKIHQTRAMIDRAVDFNKYVLENPQIYSPKAREVANSDLQHLRNLKADYDEVAKGFEGPLKPRHFDTVEDATIADLESGTLFTVGDDPMVYEKQ